MSTLAVNDTSHHGAHQCHWVAEYGMIFFLGQFFSQGALALLHAQAVFWVKPGRRKAVILCTTETVSALIALLQVWLMDVDLHAKTIINAIGLFAYWYSTYSKTVAC